VGRNGEGDRLLEPQNTRAGIFKKSMGARHRGGIGFSYRPARLQSTGSEHTWWYRGAYGRSALNSKYAHFGTREITVVCRIKKSVPLYDVNTGERRIDMRRERKADREEKER
jgi:hypothetical protein